MPVRAPWRRLAAWAIDCLCILGWVAVTAAVGIPLYLAGVIRPTGTLPLNVIGALVIVVPVTLALAGLEHRFGATAGKRALGLRVEAAGARPSFPRALLRNALKVALPWLIGHAAVYAAVGDLSPTASWLLAAAYIVPVLYVVMLFVGSGCTPYDRISGSTVVVGIVRCR
jgi:uncharacterized RDD family membrane protein YckC